MSYHTDSRNENVELDYNNLRVRGPIEFLDDVTFNGGFLIGVVWPRLYKVTGTDYVYGGGSIESTIPLTAQTVLYNDFAIPPTNTHTGYFTVANTGIVTATIPSGTARFHILARIACPLGFTVAAEILFKLYVNPAGASPPFALDSVMLNPVALGVTQEVVKMESIYPGGPGDTFYVTIQSASVPTVILELAVSVLK